MALITTVLALIAILTTLYASDSLRNKSERSSGGFLKSLFKFIDEILLEPEAESSKESKSTVQITTNVDMPVQKYFDESFPAFKHVGMDSPVSLADARVLFIDMEGVKNSNHGRTLLFGFMAFLAAFSILALLLLFSALHDASEGEYINIAIYLVVSIVLFYIIIKSLDKIKTYSDGTDSILKSINSSIILIVISEEYTLFHYGRYKTTISTNKISEFTAEENKLFWKKESGNYDLLVHFPSIYARRMRHKVDFKYISCELNKFLDEMKAISVENQAHD